MPNFLVVRHGYNKANQSMTNVMGVCIVEAKNREEAIALAAEDHTVYHNQFLSAIPESKLNAWQIDEWNEISYRESTTQV